MAGRRTLEKGLSRIERERRAQLIAATIGLVAARGYAAASLSQIAQAAGVTKGTVVYHFASKDAVLAAAYRHVLEALVADVGEAVDAAPAEQAPAVYVRRMIGHLAERPSHARMLAEAGLHAAAGDGGEPEAGPPAPSSRRENLAALLAEARRARGLDDGPDPRTLAVLISGMIDAVVAAHLEDPSYDTAQAAETIVRMLENELFTR
jgi:TetR/AcrR family transcriptional regulator